MFIFEQYNYIPYSRKIWRGIKFGALADRPTGRQIKNPPIFNTRIYVYGIDTWPAGPPTREAQPSRIIMGVVDLWQAHERELIVDLSCFLTCMLGGVRLLTMSLYRLFTKAGMPSRVPSLSDKEIENANTSTSTYVRVD